MKKMIAFALVLVLVVAGVGGVVLAFVNDNGDSNADPSSTESTTSTTSAKFTGEGAKAFCDTDAQLDAAIAAAAPTTTDAAALKGDYERRVVAVRALEQVAPAEIKPDVTIVRNAYEALTPALASVGYDMSKVSQADRASVQSPEVTRAGQRLEQYDEKVCKLTTGG